MLAIAEWTGKRFFDVTRNIFEIVDLFCVSLKELCTWNRCGKRVLSNLLFRQILFTGVDALPIISIISILLGAIVVTQSTTQLPLLGGEEFIGKVITVVIIRELGPLLTAIIVIGRSCSAIATELGIMRINQEVEALEMMGISVTRLLVLPRVLGCLISMLFLTIYFDVMAILGGFAISNIQMAIPMELYLHRIALSLNFNDIFVFLLKSVSFGIIIAVVSVYNGLKVKHFATEVPQATTKAVISSVVACFLYNSALTIIFYM